MSRTSPTKPAMPSRAAINRRLAALRRPPSRRGGPRLMTGDLGSLAERIALSILLNGTGEDRVADAQRVCPDILAHLAAEDGR